MGDLIWSLGWLLQLLYEAWISVELLWKQKDWQEGHCGSPGNTWWWLCSVLLVEMEIRGSSAITESM